MTTTKLRKSITQHRAEAAKRPTPPNNYLPALEAERKKQYADRAARGVLAAPVRANANHYSTGDGETLQPNRPGSEQAAQLKSHGYSC